MAERPKCKTFDQRVRVLENELAQAENSPLKPEHDKFNRLFNAIADWAYIVSPDFVIEAQSDSSIGYFGNRKGEKCHRAIRDVNRPCDFCVMKEAIDAGMTKSLETTLSDGRIFEGVFSPFKDVDGTNKTIILIRDITEKKALQAVSMRAGQLAALGEFVGGIAHEINNPLNGIISYAEILADQFQETGADTEIPERIIKEGDRIAGIIRGLLLFSRHRQGVKAPMCIRDALLNVAGLVRKQFQKDGIRIELDLAAHVPEIFANEQNISQVFLDMISNSRHALNLKYPAWHESKVLRISCGQTEIDGLSWVQTVFFDQGIGIPATMMDRIFTPFFSTKPAGEGTGLGLSTSRGIIGGHGGRLHMESEEGVHTKVCVCLPARKMAQ